MSESIYTSRAEAKANGDTFYFTGKPCKHGHTTNRLTSCGVCHECHQQHRLINDIHYKKTAAARRQIKSNHISAVNKRWRIDNRDRLIQYRSTNTEYFRDYRRTYAKRRRDLINAHQAHRRAAKLQATPFWANRESIRMICTKCQELNQTWGTTFEVDHIVPLQGKTVCGLHCEANLQLLDETLNITKKNLIWPDMP